MLKLIRFVAVLGALALACTATAQVPLWYLDQVYTTADRTVQYVVFVSYFSDQQHLAGTVLTAAPQPGYGTGTHTFTFPNDLPGDSLNRRMLIATQGFADLNVLEPDYVVPNGFFPVPAGLLGIQGRCCWDYFDPPTDGVRSLQYPDFLGMFGTDWAIDTAVATNFAGQQYVSTVPPPAAPPLVGWTLDEIFSNADGSVQFAVLSTTDNGEQLISGSTLVATGLAVGSRRTRQRRTPTFTFTFPNDLALEIDSANHSFLIATHGFAALHILEPDYVVANGFFPLQGGHISILGGEYDFGALPQDGVNALELQDAVPGQSPTWTVDTAVAVNFSGQQYVFTPSTLQPPPPPPCRRRDCRGNH